MNDMNHLNKSITPIVSFVEMQQTLMEMTCWVYIQMSTIAYFFIISIMLFEVFISWIILDNTTVTENLLTSKLNHTIAITMVIWCNKDVFTLLKIFHGTRSKFGNRITAHINFFVIKKVQLSYCCTKWSIYIKQKPKQKIYNYVLVYTYVIVNYM